MSDQMKLTWAIYVLHSRQGQSLGDQDFSLTNLVNDPQFFIWSGGRAHIYHDLPRVEIVLFKVLMFDIKPLKKMV